MQSYNKMYGRREKEETWGVVFWHKVKQVIRRLIRHACYREYCNTERNWYTG